jgi:hypothetical protein
MDPPELASEPAPCYARRGRIEPPMSYLELRTLDPLKGSKSQLLFSQWLRLHGLTSSDLGARVNRPTNVLSRAREAPKWKRNLRRESVGGHLKPPL